MINYYEVLGLEHPASHQEIKSSFRRKAKEIHPDVQLPSDRMDAEDRMRLLLAAYQVLSDPLKKEEYDRSFIRHFRTTKFEYREFLRQRQDDYFSQARLVFHDLLNSNAEEAVILYEFLTSQRPTFRLEHFLDHEDYMDCAFLLAEALESRGNLTSAYKLYRQIYICETERPYFHHFIDEVVDRLRDLVCFKMAERFPPQFTISYIKDLMSFSFSRKDNAFFYKKIAELCLSQGDKRLAVSYLRKGLALNGKLAGVKKLKEKIGYTEVTPR
ncbi:MAG: DnaJ domain-containing protein [Candidatus Eisenbacteria bacterium]|nr:DnaJ domain-containing protein [Candidatus Eisenbacteria bacterium]